MIQRIYFHLIMSPFVSLMSHIIVIIIYQILKRKKIYYINIINLKKRNFLKMQDLKTTMTSYNCGLIKTLKEQQEISGSTTLKGGGQISITGSMLLQVGLRRQRITQLPLKLIKLNIQSHIQRTIKTYYRTCHITAGICCKKRGFLTDCIYLVREG